MARVRDDRGVVHGGVRIQPRSRPLETRTLRTGIGRLHFLEVIWFTLSIIAGFVVVAPVLSWLDARFARLNWHWAVSGASILAVYFTVLYAWVRFVVVAVHKRIEKRIDRWHRACRICRYPLGDLQTEGDGCTVCPECGAAWRVGAEEH